MPIFPSYHNHLVNKAFRARVGQANSSGKHQKGGHSENHGSASTNHSHGCKGADDLRISPYPAQQTKTVKRLQASARLALSGTPVENQATDRAYRIGQMRPVLVHKSRRARFRQFALPHLNHHPHPRSQPELFFTLRAADMQELIAAAAAITKQSARVPAKKASRLAKKSARR